MTPVGDGELERVVDMARALRAGKVSSRELIERALARAEAWQPASNAFSQLWPEQALDEARRVDAIDRGERPPLAGIPIAVKDLFDVAARETTGCCAAYRGSIAGRDAPTIERVRQAGLVMIGKTNQHELAAGATNVVSACGRAGNPWNPDRITGGSSGGSAAAVAAGVVPWSLGSDTGGSIRIPAAMCGAFGLKPTTGAIPIDGLLPHSPSLDCPGPIAGTAGETWRLYRLLLGGLDGSGDDHDEPELRRERRLRLGVPGDGYFRDSTDAETQRVLQETTAVFEAAGAPVEAIPGTGIEDARHVWARVAYPELHEAHPQLQERRELVDPTVLALLDFGERVTPEERAAASRRSAEIARWFRERLEGFDALVVPTTPTPAPPASEFIVPPGAASPALADRPGPGWLTCSVNLAGLPAINLPAGRSAEGLPIGVSLVGASGAEPTLIELATLWEEASGYRPEIPAAP